MRWFLWPVNKLHLLLRSFSSQALSQLLMGPKHNFCLESSKDLCALVQQNVAGMTPVTVITLKMVSRGTLVRKTDYDRDKLSNCRLNKWGDFIAKLNGLFFVFLPMDNIGFDRLRHTFHVWGCFKSKLYMICSDNSIIHCKKPSCRHAVYCSVRYCKYFFSIWCIFVYPLYIYFLHSVKGWNGKGFHQDS